MLWGRHPNYAYGQWIKLAVGHNKKELAYREQLGFELVYVPKGTNPNGHIDYQSGHPWYYFLEGTVLTPSQILEAVLESGYQGYDIEHIKKMDAEKEPQRSEALAET